jgi:signal peptide peptidase SppA
MIMHRGSGMEMSGPGGTSTEGLTAQLRQAVNDPNVKAIVLDVDSPGGDVDGVEELATEIFNARKQKKITAVSNCLCASAAYYLACQASELVVSPSSLTGSIGVYTMHEDDSKYLEDVGVKLTLIKFGENKAEGNNIEPLTDAARGHLQEMVDTFGAMFEKAVARGRKVSQDAVHNKFGQGRVFDAKQAVKIGMADRIATFDEVLQGYGVSRNPGPAAAKQGPGISAQDSVPALSAATPGSPQTDPGLRGGTNDDEYADVDDPEDNACACACAECKAGNCKACSNEACEDEACAGAGCPAGSAKSRNSRQAMERRRLEISAA